MPVFVAFNFYDILLKKRKKQARDVQVNKKFSMTHKFFLIFTEEQSQQKVSFLKLQHACYNYRKSFERSEYMV